jgi:hypothetical protein
MASRAALELLNPLVIPVAVTLVALTPTVTIPEKKWFPIPMSKSKN